MARFLRSTSARLSLRFAGLYAIITALVFGLSYHFADREISGWVADQLAEEAAGFSSLYDNEGLDAVRAQLGGFAGFNFEDYRIYLLEDADGRVLAGNVEAIDRQASSGYVTATAVQAQTPRYEDVMGYVLHSVQLGPNRLTLGTSTYFLEELQEVLGRGLVAGFVLLLLAGLVAGIVVGRRTERRLNRISATLKSVALGQLDRRVPVTGGDGDDLARMAAEINRTIARLQQMVESQKQISADIAHDLRTPMQRLRQRLDVLRHAPDLPPQITQDAEQAVEIADDLIETFHALLRIAQIEAGQRSVRFAATPLAPILARIEDAYGPVAEENGQTLVFDIEDPGATVQGDQQLLTQMVANLIENALRHTPAATRIEGTLTGADDGVLLRISDNGPGIPAAERDKVFRRFYRLEKSRTTPGNGLGLSMVRAIAELHEATVVLGDNRPGLCVTVRFRRDALSGG
ncbi:HAMP domain-containing sensor histidine kinase [Paracoccus sp. 1_MG-2023]|uniref:sensor histidine kinase n=1 Tax=unclassified Paracoccus (in: a-proteobacteria) TaxID=2688777 RepID=UPI001C08A0F5|nr:MULTISPECIES: HAMP domain-containing sensor histidine kinase [unclassified Paracoccus (in: a-proteobacteria)]MBU2959183.1 HAMP domain-containing histidine kinase [Paracoccus sp. C2R09]MDO6670080.1 HAMP domain-containing sensor histidine kinase [Paracoccus sp. 1_MG-2023]